jgi:hypothetical protein
MQEQQEAKHRTGMKWQQTLSISRNTIILLLVIIAGSVPLSSSFALPRWHNGVLTTSAASQIVPLNGANRWVGDRQTTTPTFDFSLPTSSSQAVSVSPLFARYYTSHSDASSLGAPLTVAFPTEQGWIQFFGLGALLLPTVQQAHTLHGVSQPENALTELAELIDLGVRDPGTGVMRLPLLQALLTMGSLVPLDGAGSSLTYVDLRNATNPSLMQPAPIANHPAPLSSPLAESQAVFSKGGSRADKDVGHVILPALWNYIHSPAISPDGWDTDFGAPLTEALAFTITKQGSVHHMLVQAFQYDGVILDQDDLNAAGQPEIDRLATGLAYLNTLGPPTLALPPQQTIWAQGETALLTAPSSGQMVAHVGQSFPLTLLGDATWNSGMLWYHVQWKAPKRTSVAWVSATRITFNSPGNGPGWASFDVLSPDLAAYLARIGGNMAAVVYDVTRQRYYTYRPNAQLLTGSSIKVPIMLTFFDMIERQGRQPSAYEMHLLTTMIENSNNDSAGILYNVEIGDAAGVAAYMQRIGITGLNPYPGAFGWSLISPLAMVNLLTRLHEGTILTAHDRQLALYLMEHIQYDQQVGVGDTAPAGATAALKDGWVRGPDNLWSMNSSGIVTLGQETYIIAVYTQEQYFLESEQAMARHVCGAVASQLI